MHRFEMRLTKDDSIVLEVRDFAINGEATIANVDFPSRNALPDGLKVVETGDLKNVGGDDRIMKQLLRVIGVHAALNNPAWRTHPSLSNIDWMQAKKANQTFGPPLRELLGAQKIERSPRPDAPNDGPLKAAPSHHE